LLQAPPAIPLATPANRQGKLNLSDSTIMWEEADSGGCVINNDFKILWVVNSENYIYKRNALNRAKKVSHSELYCKTLPVGWPGPCTQQLLLVD
jgi:hypothetical protein